MSGREVRLGRIRSLLAGGRVPSQNELGDRLRAEGVRATQATLSRDLRELGALKGPSGYTLPESLGAAPPPGHEGLARALAAFMHSAIGAGSVVVLRTGPGQAPAMALEIDRAGLADSAGTVAGDDTVFVATPGPRQAARLAREFLRAARGQASRRGRVRSRAG